MKEFRELGLSQEVVKVLEESGFEKPTEIQKKTIPLALEGKDIIGGSATGSGKTLAFAAPIIEKLVPNHHIQVLILTPTRELAEQVTNSIKIFSKYKRLNVLAIYGGVSIQPQISKMSIADIVVGTPGRILDHLDRRTLRLDAVKYLVLDEVDRMFDMGFRDDVEKIVRQCPEHRQTLMFSATVSQDIDYLVKRHTKNPVTVSVESYVDPSKLRQVYYDVQQNMKFSLLVHLLKQEKADLVMVFCSTRRNVDFVSKNLRNLGINAQAIHGGLSQNNRSRVLEQFTGKGVGVLVCTDIAARGLDIAGVSHVYNYDLPTSSNDYIHRIGRTARAGADGIAINILAGKDYNNFSNIQRDESLKISLVDLPEFETIPVESNFRERRFGRDSHFGRRDRPRSEGRSFGPRRSFRRDDDRPRSFGPRRSFRRDENSEGEGGRRFDRSEGGDRPRRRFNTNRSRSFSRPRY